MTYGTILELGKDLQNLCDDRCPRSDVSGLRFRIQRDVRCENVESQPIAARHQSIVSRQKKRRTYGAKTTIISSRRLIVSDP